MKQDFRSFHQSQEETGKPLDETKKIKKTLQVVEMIKKRLHDVIKIFYTTKQRKDDITPTNQEQIESPKIGKKGFHTKQRKDDITSTNQEQIENPKIGKKDFNTKMAIDVPNNEGVDFVNMGSCHILDDNSKEHLLTYGLGPCAGVAIVIKSNSGELIRLLAHIDMGQLLGISIKSFSQYLETMKSKIADGIKSVEISITSTESFNNLKNLKENELKLVNVISSKFKENGITPKDIKYNYSTQVQISPQGKISTYSESELKLHKQNMFAEDINRFGGYIEHNLNIYITKYGAWMSNCGKLRTKEKKENYLKEYYEEEIKNGYKIKIAQSFNDPDQMATYLENWEDKRLRKRGGIPGCKTAKESRNRTAA